jgi:prolipoprotein diacylglyceryl transferase
MVHATGALPQFIPSPAISGFHIGPLLIHFYALGYIIGITLAVLITRRRWHAMGGDPDVVNDLALWVVPAGIIGGRIYFDITTPQDIPHVWYGALAVWSGGLGIWGGVALATLVGAWRLRRQGLTVGPFANAIAPALLVAQAVGRIGNYFNKELFGKPTSLPWALQVPPGYRPPGYELFATFQPTFLYELIWDLGLAAFLVWLGHHAKIKNWSLFALYVAGYSAFRIFEESVRIDSSEHFLGLRLNMYIAILGTAGGLAWFALAQRRDNREPVVRIPPAPDTPAVEALDEAEPEAEPEPGTESLGAEPEAAPGGERELEPESEAGQGDDRQPRPEDAADPVPEAETAAAESAEPAQTPITGQ